MALHLWEICFTTLCLTWSISWGLTGFIQVCGYTKRHQWYNPIMWHLACDWTWVLYRKICIWNQLHMISNQLQKEVWFYDVSGAARSHGCHWIFSIKHTCVKLMYHIKWDLDGMLAISFFTSLLLINFLVILNVFPIRPTHRVRKDGEFIIQQRCNCNTCSILPA